MTDWSDMPSFAGKYVSLVPLALQHHDELVQAANDGELHRIWYTSVPSPENMATEIERRLALRTAGSMTPFAVIQKDTGKAVGMTTYMSINAEHRGLEIGSTWYAQSVQRSPLNTECKLLLLQHAFEKLDCIRVEFWTHFMNNQSRRAIERLGAKLDGVLRSNLIMANGTIRDTAVYSIIANELPAVKANLKWQLEKPRP